MVKCNDIDLVVLLDTDDDIDLHRPEISRHLESCQHCQDRLALGAADTDQWDEVQRQLFSGGIADPEYVQSLAARQKWKRPKAWTDAMAQRLLSPPSHPEMLGRVGRYDVERLIGHGGMGVVLKAYDTELNRPVAVKLLAPHLAKTEPHANDLRGKLAPRPLWWMNTWSRFTTSNRATIQVSLRSW